jgi:hypothetical protein
MDLLASLVLEVRCPSCGQVYEVSAANVLESQEMLNEACLCRSETECPPVYLASLLNGDDLKTLLSVLERLCAQATSHGAVLRLTNQTGRE